MEIVWFWDLGLVDWVIIGCVHSWRERKSIKRFFLILCVALGFFITTVIFFFLFLFFILFCSVFWCYYALHYAVFLDSRFSFLVTCHRVSYYVTINRI